MPPSPDGRQHPCVQAEGQGPRHPRLTGDETRVTCPRCHRPSVTKPGLERGASASELAPHGPRGWLPWARV